MSDRSGKIVQIGRAKPTKYKTYRGVGVAIWVQQPFAFAVIGNQSGVLPLDKTFPHMFGDKKK